MRKEKIFILTIFVILVFLSSCGKSINYENVSTNSNVNIESVSVSEESASKVDAVIKSETPKEVTFDTIKKVRDYDSRDLSKNFMSVRFGKYEQDNNEANGKEDIEWIVLNKDGSKLLLLSKYILDKVEYSDNPTGFIYYDESHIRNWLNTNFYNDAFDDVEKNVLQRNYYDNYAISYKTLSGEGDTAYESRSTMDLVSLISYKELVQYIGKPSDTEKDQFHDRRTVAYPTEFAKNILRDIYRIYLEVEKNKVWYEGCSPYWLRSMFNLSSGSYTSLVAVVNTDGTVSFEEDKCSYVGVRPMILIDTALIDSGKAKYMLSHNVIESPKTESASVNTNADLNSWEMKFFAPVINGGFQEDMKHDSTMSEGYLRGTFTYGLRDIDRDDVKELLFFYGTNLYRIYKLANDYYEDYELYNQMYYPIGILVNYYEDGNDIKCYLYESNFIIQSGTRIYTMDITDMYLDYLNEEQKKELYNSTNYVEYYYDRIYLKDEDIEIYESYVYDTNSKDGLGEYTNKDYDSSRMSKSEADVKFSEKGNPIVLNDGVIVIN